MASAAAGETIMFIGSMLAAIVVATALGSVAADYSSSLKDRSSQMAVAYGEDIEVVSDPANVLVVPFRLYVKNTGDVAFATSSLVIMVDGTASILYTVTVNALPVTVIQPGALAMITILDITPLTGDHRVVLLAGSSAQDIFEFTR